MKLDAGHRKVWLRKLGTLKDTSALRSLAFIPKGLCDGRRSRNYDVQTVSF